MSRSFFPLLFLLAPFFLQAQTYGWGQAGPLTVRDTVIQVDLSSEGLGVFSARLAAPLPGASPLHGAFAPLAFGHGFQMRYDVYGALQERLASWGYITVSPDVQNGFSPNHAEFGQQLAALIRWAQADSNSSLLPQPVLAHGAVMGHSMGGGAAMLALQELTDSSVGVGLSAAETNTSAIGALGQAPNPVLLISGDADRVTPEADHAQPMFTASNTVPRSWVSLVGGGHCLYTTLDNAICNFGAVAVGENPQLSLVEQRERALQYALPFLEYYLHGRNAALPWVCGDSIRNDPSLNLQSTLALAGTACQIQAPNQRPHLREGASVYPNPTNSNIHLPQAGTWRLLDLQGRELHQMQAQYPNASTPLPVSPGLYFLQSPSGVHYRVLKLQP